MIKEIAKGLAFTLKKMGTHPITVQWPGGAEAGFAAPSRPAHPPPVRQRARALHRLRAVRRRLSGGVHLRARRRERPEGADLTRRAVRRALRDQPHALHLLRVLRRGVPDRGDHARPAIRAGRLPPRANRRHQGRAARVVAGLRAGAGPGEPGGRRRRSDRPRRPRSRGAAARGVGRAGEHARPRERTAPRASSACRSTCRPSSSREPGRRDDGPLRGGDRARRGQLARRRALPPDHLLGAEPRAHRLDARRCCSCCSTRSSSSRCS